MTIFGKVLIFFNLLVAGAFAYFSVQDYHGEKGKGNGRQHITAAGVRHVILVDGLPLGDKEGAPTEIPSDPEAEIPFEVNLAGGYRTSTVGKKLIEAYFQPAPGGDALGGGAVPNQLAEVKRVKAKIDAALEALAEKPDDKLAALAGWLLPQAHVYEERQAIQKMIADKDAKAMEERLAARFAAVIDAPKPVEDDAKKSLAKADAEDPVKQKEKVEKVDASRIAPIDDTERRARLAHLLVHLSPDPDWQKRVAMVVGLRRYASAIVAQAERFVLMADRVKRVIPADQLGYLSHERFLLRLAIDRTDLANRQADLKLKWIEQEKKESDFVGQRDTQLKAIQARFAKTKAEVDDMLARQTNIEAALFEVQREVAITLDEVYRLELVLEARERDLLGLPRAGGN